MSRGRRGVASRKPSLSRGRSWKPALEALYDKLFGHAGVVGCFVGRKTTRFRQTEQLAIVCCVEEKTSRRKLIPKLLQTPFSAPHHQLPSDIVELPRAVFRPHAGVIGPGDGITTNTGIAGTVGVAVRLSDGRRAVLTAGHVVSGARTVRLTSGPLICDGVVLADVTAISERLDYGVIVPDSSVDLDNLYVDQLFGDRDRVGNVYQPMPPGDIHRLLFILAADGRPRRVSCRGLEGAFVLPDGTVLRDVILTEPVTVPGDSGCCLIDGNRHAWGLLRGAVAAQAGMDLPTYSAFSLLEPSLRDAGATFLNPWKGAP